MALGVVVKPFRLDRKTVPRCVAKLESRGFRLVHGHSNEVMYSGQVCKCSILADEQGRLTVAATYNLQGETRLACLAPIQFTELKGVFRGEANRDHA